MDNINETSIINAINYVNNTRERKANDKLTISRGNGDTTYKISIGEKRSNISISTIKELLRDDNREYLITAIEAIKDLDIINNG
jgi:hypothetical protein